MEGNDNEGILYAPLKKGEIIKNPAGDRCQVIGVDDASYNKIVTVRYKTRNLRTNGVTMVSTQCQLQLTDNSSLYPSHPLVEDAGYYQITEMSRTGMATLKKFELAEGEKELVKKILIKNPVDKKTISEGLKGREVFCTVATVMGQDVLGQIKCMQIDPLLLRMPDLVLDTMVSFLSLEDQMTCRLVSRRLAYDVLPITKFRKCSELSVSNAMHTPRLKVKLLQTGRERSSHCYFGRFAHSFDEKGRITQIQYIKEMYSSGLFKHVETILFTCDSVQQSEVDGLLEECRNVKNLRFMPRRSKSKKDKRRNPAADEERMRGLIQGLIANNKEHIQHIAMETTAWKKDPEFCADFQMISGCNSLKVLNLSLTRKNPIRNLKALPPSIIDLSLTGLSEPLTKSELTWISTNLTSLKKLKVDVKHSHSENEEDEVGADVVLLFANMYSMIRIHLNFGKRQEELTGHIICRKMQHLQYGSELKVADWKREMSNWGNGLDDYFEELIMVR